MAENGGQALDARTVDKLRVWGEVEDADGALSLGCRNPWGALRSSPSLPLIATFIYALSVLSNPIEFCLCVSEKHHFVIYDKITKDTLHMTEQL